MEKYNKLFSSEKAIVLNAIYDALDAIGFVIDNSDSTSGIIMVSYTNQPYINARITVCPLISDDKTNVEVYLLENDHKHTKWISALFDETESLIKKAENLK